MPEQFAHGHVPNAINIPWNASGGLRENRLIGLPKHAQLVVYCGDNECGAAKETAKLLSADGFTNLWLFPGGWEEWNHRFLW